MNSKRNESICSVKRGKPHFYIDQNLVTKDRGMLMRNYLQRGKLFYCGACVLWLIFREFTQVLLQFEALFLSRYEGNVRFVMVLVWCGYYFTKLFYHYRYPVITVITS